MTVVTSDRGVAKVCDKNNNPMDRDTGLRANSGCTGGNAFICDDFQPVPVSEDLTYGFGIYIADNQLGDNPACCKCYDVQWLSGGATGKHMILQIVTPGGEGHGIKKGDLVILTPGGGLGPLNKGCSAQFGRSYDSAWYVRPTSHPCLSTNTIHPIRIFWGSRRS